jgi:hypothetical protein
MSNAYAIERWIATIDARALARIATDARDLALATYADRHGVDKAIADLNGHGRKVTPQRITDARRRRNTLTADQRQKAIDLSVRLHGFTP